MLFNDCYKMFDNCERLFYVNEFSLFCFTSLIHGDTVFKNILLIRYYCL